MRWRNFQKDIKEKWWEVKIKENFRKETLFLWKCKKFVKNKDILMRWLKIQRNVIKLQMVRKLKYCAFLSSISIFVKMLKSCDDI